jgi:hypothetical protein
MFLEPPSVYFGSLAPRPAYRSPKFHPTHTLTIRSFDTSKTSMPRIDMERPVGLANPRGV